MAFAKNSSQPYIFWPPVESSMELGQRDFRQHYCCSPRHSILYTYERLWKYSLHMILPKNCCIDNDALQKHDSNGSLTWWRHWLDFAYLFILCLDYILLSCLMDSCKWKSQCWPKNKKKLIYMSSVRTQCLLTSNCNSSDCQHFPQSDQFCL